MFQKRTRLHPLTVGAVLIVLVSALIGSALGKYIQTTTVSGNVTFTAKLAKDLLIQEHKAERKPDGSYGLLTGDENIITLTSAKDESYAYTLIPGLDIPKDTFVKVEGKTPLEAYLFLEVVETLDTVKVNDRDVKLVDYTVDAGKWKKLGSVTGKNGGSVYVYAVNGNAGVLDKETTDPFTVPILSPEMITISQYVKSYDIKTDNDTDLLSFYASMGETALDPQKTEATKADPVTVYKAIYNLS